MATNGPTAPTLLDLHPQSDDLRDAIHQGMRRLQKRLPTLLLYDERGSQLFDAITEVPEYYPTRTELSIMDASMEQIAKAIGPQASLIELGSGSSMKTRLLLQQLPELAAYVPVDISRDHLMAAATELARDYPAVEVLPVCADFNEPFRLPTPRISPQRNIVYFPGSTIGNLDFGGAHKLLSTMRRIAKKGGAVLIGVDLVKPREILEPAYDDAQGVTADFNLNILTRLNREFGANFNLEHFHHRAVWDGSRSRIEMRLVSEIAQEVEIDGERFSLAANEHILTEYSHKYSLEVFANLARTAGFEVECVWTDPQQWFSVQYLVVN
ncbi:MAG: L-histidine N(alpha)-methyltransferase [Pseudomonadota bacterium]